MKKLRLLLVLVLLGATLAYAAMAVTRRDTTPRIAAGVVLTLSGQRNLAVNGYTAGELTVLLAEEAQRTMVPPVEPYMDAVNQGLIPGLAGRQLSIARTVEKLLNAPPQSRVTPEFDWVLPEKSLWECSTHAIYRGNPAKQQIALVINVAWGNEHLPRMLEILEQERVKASFFLVGRWVDQNADMVARIAAAGHEFGNHAYSDPHLPQLGREAITREIVRTTEAIQQITGKQVRFFSPPYNDFNQTVLDVASELGYLTVLCSLDTADWMRPGVDRIVRRIVPRAHNGAIVLMHPTEQTPAALERIIAGLKSEGYQLVTVGELLSAIPGEPVGTP